MAFRLTEGASYYSELVKMIHIFQYLQELYLPTAQ